MTGVVAPLTEWFARAERVLLGFSGGIDSALLAVVGTRTLGADRFIAVIGRSPSLPTDQLGQARALAARFAVPVRELDTAELDDPRYRANATDRCFYCKTELWARLGALAAAEGYGVVIDGTHADDQGDHRPGARAGALAAVRSPLLEVGWGKARVREAAQALGLPNWDAPAAPCLASRIQYGLEVTPARLRQVELAEAWLRSIGVGGNLRVRHHGGLARVEVDRAMFPVVEAAWPELERRFADWGFERIELDPRGYRRGNLLPVAT